VADESDKTDGDGDDRDCAGDEFVIPGPMLPDGSRECLRHAADHSVQRGFMRPLEDGKPLREDAVLLERREGTPFFDIVGSVAEIRKGPSKAVSNAYRKGWDAVFGGKPDPKAN
jgi:hypothetical protein